MNIQDKVKQIKSGKLTAEKNVNYFIFIYPERGCRFLKPMSELQYISSILLVPYHPSFIQRYHPPAEIVYYFAVMRRQNNRRAKFIDF